MSVAIATLPRPGNGSALLRGIAALFAVSAAPAVAKKAPTSAAAKKMSLWQLYRLTVGYDSISPKVAAELRKQLVG